jgi:DNA-binding MurR/RpiR family transcriptional regulator
MLHFQLTCNDSIVKGIGENDDVISRAAARRGSVPLPPLARPVGRIVGVAAPSTYEQLINAISESYPAMSRRFQEIARFVVQNPNEVALSSVKSTATRIGLNPSALVRFAQRFEFSGYSEMQRLFQARLLNAAPGINDRLRALRRELGGAGRAGQHGPLRDLVLADVAALHHLLDVVSEADLGRAADLLARARTVYVIGQYRAFPVAQYLHYAMVYFRRDVRLIDGAGGLATDQAQIIGPDCVLLAVSFRFYAREVVDIVEATHARGVPIIAIADSQLSPLAKHATVAFLVAESEHNFAHSLAAPMCMALGLVIGMADHLGAELGAGVQGKPPAPD